MLRFDDVTLRHDAFALTANLSVSAGARVAVMGPSGSGKSTLLAGIAGFLLPASGRILWDAHDLGPLPPGKRPVTMLFQDNNLFPHLTAQQNVALGRADRNAAAAALALSEVGLAGLEGRRPADLSGGQQGRVALARALIRDRPILLLDEPFAALGPGMRQDMIGLVRNVADKTGATVLMVSHDPTDALALDGLILPVVDGVADMPRAAQALLKDPPPPLAAYFRR